METQGLLLMLHVEPARTTFEPKPPFQQESKGPEEHSREAAWLDVRGSCCKDGMWAPGCLMIILNLAHCIRNP
jgi:hypothetical protein